MRPLRKYKYHSENGPAVSLLNRTVFWWAFYEFAEISSPKEKPDRTARQRSGFQKSVAFRNHRHGIFLFKIPDRLPCQGHCEDEKRGAISRAHSILRSLLFQHRPFTGKKKDLPSQGQCFLYLGRIISPYPNLSWIQLIRLRRIPRLSRLQCLLIMIYQCKELESMHK